MASQTTKITTFHFYLTVFQVLLYRFLKTEDLCLGVVDANRIDPEFLQTTGFILNILRLRFTLKGDESCKNVAQTTRTKACAALDILQFPSTTLSMA